MSATQYGNNAPSVRAQDVGRGEFEATDTAHYHGRADNDVLLSRPPVTAVSANTRVETPVGSLLGLYRVFFYRHCQGFHARQRQIGCHY